MSKKTKHVLVLITVNVFFILVCFFVLVPESPSSAKMPASSQPGCRAMYSRK